MRRPSTTETCESKIRWNGEPPAAGATEPDNGKAINTHDDVGSTFDWEIPWDSYVELSDTVATTISKCATGHPIAHNSAILLKTSSKGSFDFIDPILARLANEHDASLVTCNLSDLEDLSWEFGRQIAERKRSDLPIPTPDSCCYSIPGAHETTYSEHLVASYFAALSRFSSGDPFWLGKGPKPIPINALIDSTKTDTFSNDAEKEAETAPLIIHLRAINDLLKLDNGLDIIENFRHYVEKHRSNGEQILLVVSASVSQAPLKPDSDDDNALRVEYSCYKERRLREELQIRDDSVVCMPAMQQGPDSSETKPSRKVERHAHKIRCEMRHYMPEDLLDQFQNILAPHSQWDFGDVLLSFEKSALSGANAERAAKQICGRAIRNKALCEEDIKSVLKRVHSSSELLGEKKPSPAELFKRRIDELRDDCRGHEEDMLDCIVDTNQLETKFDDVVIDNEAKETVKQLIGMSQLSSQTHPLLRQVQMKGALFYGPPGTGKTHLTRAIARESGASMLAVDAGQLMVKWVGDTEKNILALFSLCAKLHPCILFIDEADALFGRRTGNDTSWRRNHVTLMLQQMDGLTANEKTPFVIVATNRPSDLDEAFLRRLPHKVHFPLPTEKERKSILRLWLKDEDITDAIIIDQLARKTEGYSGADLKSLCGQAALTWRVEQAGIIQPPGDSEKPKFLLTAQHFAKALKRSHPAATRVTKKMNEDFRLETTARA